MRVVRSGPTNDDVVEEHARRAAGGEPEPADEYAGDGIWYPGEFIAVHDNEPRGLRYTLAVRGGHCVGLTVSRLDGTRLRADDVERIPLARYTERALDAAGFDGEARPAPGAARAARRYMTEARFAEAAAVYRQAYEAGIPPTVAVAEHLYVSKATAGRLVKGARAAGFLGPALRARPGV